MDLMQRLREREMDMADVPDIAKARLMVISDGRAGSENRSVGLAEMLGFKNPEIVTMKPRKVRGVAKLAPVRWLYPDFARLEADVRDVDVVIGAGYQVSRLLRVLKKNKPGLFTVCLMRPAGKAGDYDVVAVEQHDDYTKAENVVVTLGATNRITRDRLALEADRWRKRLDSVRGTRLALMVGGTSKHGTFDAAGIKTLVDAVTKPLKEGRGGLLVSTSRRTGASVTAALEKALGASNVPFHLWKPEDTTARDNPYLAYLALADGVIVTADSVSMVSEAASAGKPVYIWGDVKAVPKKFRQFYANLIKQGRAKWWDGAVNMRPPAAGLMDTLMVAGFVRARWVKRMKSNK